MHQKNLVESASAAAETVDGMSSSTRCHGSLPFKRSSDLRHGEKTLSASSSYNATIMKSTYGASAHSSPEDLRHCKLSHSKSSCASFRHGASSLSSPVDWVLQNLELPKKRSMMPLLEKGNRCSSKHGTARRARDCSCLLFIAIAAALICYIVVEASVHGFIGASLAKDSATSHGKAGNPFKIDLHPALDQYNVKVHFHPRKLEERLKKQMAVVSELRMQPRSSIRKPRLALVCANLRATPESAYLITLWKAMAELGYDLEVFPLKGGSLQATWEQTGASVHLHSLTSSGFPVDWSIFDCVIFSSWEVDGIMSRFLEDPFKEIPVIWIILHEEAIPARISSKCKLATQGYELPGNPKGSTIFERASVVLLSDYALAMEYSHCDTGNFFVIPGSPIPVWEAEQYMSSAHHSRGKVRASMGLGFQDIAVAVVDGSTLPYKGIWLEHAMVMQAMLPICREAQKNNVSLKLFFFTRAASSAEYKASLQILAAQLGLANDTVHHYTDKGDEERLLLAADFVVYSSMHEEQCFPSLLIKAMLFARPIVAPNLTVIRNHMEDGVHGTLYDPRGGSIKMSEAFGRVIIPQISNLPNGVAEMAPGSRCCEAYARSLLVKKSISEFARLLESLVHFPSEAHLPLPASSAMDSESTKLPWKWQQVSDHLSGLEVVEEIGGKAPERVLVDAANAVDTAHLMQTGLKNRALNAEDGSNDRITLADWEEVRLLQMNEDVERSETEQVSERNEQLRGTWEEVYRSVRKVANSRNELHERDDGELERTGQPICIYEPYFGNGTWHFVSQRSMIYRGISMIPRQRRPGFDDIESSLRLPLLNDAYYRDVLGELGAFLAIANRIDRVHKNTWIGFQSWQAAGRKVSLSSTAERALYSRVARADSGDVLYFWVSLEPQSFDFWSYCDATNNGNCRNAFLRAFRKMYGLSSEWARLPPMPMDGGRWSALNAWAMPTSSFMEFIMFSRMFVDALDSEFFWEHHEQGRCPLGSSPAEARYCYRRLLQLLVNVWAYHSGRRMVSVDPSTGSMREEHEVAGRRGRAWTSFFSFATLKAMDEDLAEEADDRSAAMAGGLRWLWPRTGEVYCQRIHDRERQQRYTLKLEKKKRDKERVRRIRSRQRQRPLARG